MVVISAALLTKSKTLLTRQFIEISRHRIEGLISAFGRLIDAGANGDHTYIETDAVRYVYIPIESIYLVLITNKYSNILEDLETLKLLQQVVQQCCESCVNEDTILTKAFDIVFALDEVISFGYRESVTLTQIKAYTEMESHDEKLSLIVLQEKMKEEKKRSRQIALRLEKERKERQKIEAANNKIAAITAERNARRDLVTAAAAASVTPNVKELDDSTTTTTPFTRITGPTDMEAAAMAFPGKGMQLGKKKIGASSDFLSTLRATS